MQFFPIACFNLVLCALNTSFFSGKTNQDFFWLEVNHNCFYYSSLSGILVKSWAQIFATSKAQKLLFRIIDCLLLPHTVLQQEKELPAPMLAAIQKSLPLYLQV